MVDLTSDAESALEYNSSSPKLKDLETKACENSDANFHILSTPRRSKTIKIDSPSSVSSIESWKKVTASPITPTLNNNTLNNSKIKEQLEKIFSSPNPGVRTSITQIIKFLSNETIVSAKKPYIILKNHLLCPTCRIRTMKKMENQVTCECGTSFLTNLHRMDISNNIAQTMGLHENTNCYDSLDFIVLDNEMIVYCQNCSFIKQLKQT